jgi:hypothetical protein
MQYPRVFKTADPGMGHKSIIGYRTLRVLGEGQNAYWFHGETKGIQSFHYREDLLDGSKYTTADGYKWVEVPYKQPFRYFLRCWIHGLPEEV